MKHFNILIRQTAVLPLKAAPVLAGNSIAAHSMRQLVALASSSNAPVLLTGPIGAGKQAVARAIHAQSAFPDQPFIETSGGLIQADQLSARWEGTLYLQQLSEIPIPLQHALLDWLDSPQALSVRLFVAAEHSPDPDRVIAPLIHRISKLRIPCPALVQRKDDIPVMLQRLWAADLDHIPPIFDRVGWAALLDHDWAGNFRALTDFAGKASHLFGGRIVSVEQIRRLLTGQREKRLDCENFDLKQHLAEEEKLFLIESLLRSNGVLAAAAGIAGLKRTTFIAKMKRHGLARI